MSRKRLQSTSTSILECGSLPFQRKCLTSLCIFRYECLQGSCLWTLSGNLMCEYYILACVLDCVTSDKLWLPEPHPTYSSRVSWHCLPWSVIISSKVVSELVSKNQACESSSWSTLWFYTECNIGCIDFAFVIKTHCASWKCISLYDHGLSQEHPLENINVLYNKRRL